MGYAFINMLRPEYVVPLVERFNNRKWEKFNSEKVQMVFSYTLFHLLFTTYPYLRRASEIATGRSSVAATRRRLA